MVERRLGKAKVAGSTPAVGSISVVRIRPRHDKTCSADALQRFRLMLDTPAPQGVERESSRIPEGEGRPAQCRQRLRHPGDNGCCSSGWAASWSRRKSRATQGFIRNKNAEGVKPSTDSASSSINRTCTRGSNFTNLVSMDPVEGAFWIISTALDALAYVVDGLVARFFPHGAASIEAPRARRRPRRRKPFYWKHPSLRF